MRGWKISIGLMVLVGLFGCGGDGGVPAGADSGADATDSPDATRPDGGTPDGGAPTPDGGTPTPDGSTPIPDGSTPTPDGGTPDGSIPTMPGNIGASCAEDGDCTAVAGGSCMTSFGAGGFALELPGGYCTLECTPSTLPGGTDECPAGSACFGGGIGGFGGGFCAKTCTASSDCRASEGYTCQSTSFIGMGPDVCAPPMMTGGGGGDGGLPFP